MIRTGTLYLAELRRLARADGRLHLAVSVLSVMLAGLVLGARVDPQLGVYSLRSLLAAWPSVLLAGALGLGLLAPAYYWALAQYRYYCAWTLLDSGLMYLALEHEPAEMLGALASRERRARHGAAGLLGAGAGAGQAGGTLSFRGRMDALLRSYGACCNALLYQAWPAPLRWLDLGVIFISAAGLIWIGLLIGTAVLPYMLNPYGAAPGAQVLGQLRLAALCVLGAMLLRGCLRRARFDALRLALADVLEGED